jgi:hypothetical protein
MPFALSNEAAITWWDTRSGTPILFSEQDHLVGGAEKLRGGAFVSRTNFAGLPETTGYRGLYTALSEYRLGRTIDRNVKRERLEDPQPYSDGLTFYLASSPPHELSVTVQEDENKGILSHTTKVAPRFQRPNTRMHLALGFHPYFATYGEPVTIEHAGHTIRHEEIGYDAHFLRRTPGAGLKLRLGHGTILMSVTGYTHVCVWTDDIEHYICVEPVMLGVEFDPEQPETYYQVLETNRDTRTCRTKLTFTPTR